MKDGFVQCSRKGGRVFLSRDKFPSWNACESRLWFSDRGTVFESSFKIKLGIFLTFPPWKLKKFRKRDVQYWESRSWCIIRVNVNWKIRIGNSLTQKSYSFFDYETTLVHMHNDAQNLKEQQQKLFFFWKKAANLSSKAAPPPKVLCEKIQLHIWWRELH